MLDSKYIENLKELGKTHYGETLRVFLKEEYKKIDTVRGVKSFDECRGRELAVETLVRLFGFLNDEKADKGTKNQYT